MTALTILAVAASIGLTFGAGAENLSASECTAFVDASNEATQIERGYECLGACVEKCDMEVSCDANSCTTAHRWLTGPARNNSAAAQFNLGLLYANGWGVERDDAKATELYGKAARQGLAEAQYNYGVRLANGIGVEEPDTATAARFVYAAAEKGIREAPYSLGLHYLNGEGVPVSYFQAYVWFNVADRMGYEPEQRYRTWLARRLGPLETSVAGELVADIVNSTSQPAR